MCLKEKKCAKKTKALLGKNGQKLAKIRYAHKAKFACTRARGLIFSPFYPNQNFMGSAKKIIKIRPTVAELFAKLFAKKYFPIVNANP